MDSATTNRRRKQILDSIASGDSPAQIADRLRCSKTTVYKVLNNPSPDGRTLARRPAPRISADTRQAVRHIAEVYPELGVRAIHTRLRQRAAESAIGEKVPSLSTVARMVAAIRRQPASIEAAGQESAPQLIARDTSALSALRDLLREALADLNQAAGEPKERFRLRHQAAEIAVALARAESLRPVQSAALSRLARALDVLGVEMFPNPKPSLPPSPAGSPPIGEP